MAEESGIIETQPVTDNGEIVGYEPVGVADHSRDEILPDESDSSSEQPEVSNDLISLENVIKPPRQEPVVLNYGPNGKAAKPIPTPDQRILDKKIA